MAKGYNPTEYMYSSARIRAFETRIASREQIARMADAQSIESVVAQLSELGFEAVWRDGHFQREETLMSALKLGFEELSAMECADAIRFLRFGYDANNIKSLIKCTARGISADRMLLELGSVSVEQARRAYESKDYSVFPENMAEAIPDAEEAFAATADPQKIDFIIDRAAFADMLDSAKRGGIPLALQLVSAKIDLVNITVTARLIRMKLGARGGALLDEAYIKGGSIDKAELVRTLGEGSESLAKLIEYGAYSSLSPLVAEEASLGDIEKRAEDIWMGIARNARFAPFGAEVAIGYISALEYQVKNVRILLAGKEAGLSSEIIRERLRECYV